MMSGERWSCIDPWRAKRRSSLETPPGFSRLKNALMSRFASKTALIMCSWLPPSATDRFHLLIDHLLKFLGRHGGLVRANANLVNQIENALPSLPASLVARSDHRKATSVDVRVE